jgi:FtsP/CotA-like multicopper oxidase with cupredoxin domain
MTKTLESAVLLLSILLLFSGIKNNNVADRDYRVEKTSNTIVDCGLPVSQTDSQKDILTNDNRVPAGRLVNGILYLNLEVRAGNWYPESKEGLPIKVYAFAEAGKSMQLPGPLIRVTEGTEIRITVRNLVADTPVVLYGFHSRPGNQKNGVVVPYGETYESNFKAGSKGTYFYRATASKREYAGLPYYTDSQLYGAFIIDSQNDTPDPNERIFMIGIWNDTITDPNKMPNEELALNGLSWPYTERLTYTQHQKVNWRVINASNQSHPMHLHGFYYTINSRGNADSDVVFTNLSRRLAVTELIHPHQTMTLTWVPEKPGNWLFHCHTLVHIMPFSFLRKMADMSEHQKNDVKTHAHSGMGGLIMGIQVQAAEGKKAKKDLRWERKLTLIAKEQPNRFGELPANGFVLLDGDSTTTDKQISVPGPAIILNRDEPVAIKVINRLHDATTLHWHGLEIESYYDGAAGWGKMNKRLAPLILPGSSFVAHLVPPRAGTFIYHTHMHDEQLVHGMYGPLIVMEPGEKFNPETDKIFLMSSAPPLEPPVAMLNGSLNPDAMRLKAGMVYRFRLINITALNPRLAVSVLYRGKPISWRPIAKDGADLPVAQMDMVPAAEQSITIGETRDFQFRPMDRGSYFFEVRDLETEKLVVRLTLEVE